jgi:hypothetical protein
LIDYHLTLYLTRKDNGLYTKGVIFPISKKELLLEISLEKEILNKIIESKNYDLIKKYHFRVLCNISDFILTA